MNAEERITYILNELATLDFQIRDEFYTKDFATIRTILYRIQDRERAWKALKNERA